MSQEHDSRFAEQKFLNKLPVDLKFAKAYVQTASSTYRTISKNSQYLAVSIEKRILKIKGLSRPSHNSDPLKEDYTQLVGRRTRFIDEAGNGEKSIRNAKITLSKPPKGSLDSDY